MRQYVSHTQTYACVWVCDTQFLRMFFSFLHLKFPMQENVFPKKKPEHSRLVQEKGTEKPRSHDRGFSVWDRCL